MGEGDSGLTFTTVITEGLSEEVAFAPSPERWSQKMSRGRAFQAESSACAMALRWELKRGQCSWSAPGKVLVNEEGAGADCQAWQFWTANPEAAGMGGPAQGQGQDLRWVESMRVRVGQGQVIRHPGLCLDPWRYLLLNLWARRCPVSGRPGWLRGPGQCQALQFVLMAENICDLIHSLFLWK